MPIRTPNFAKHRLMQAWRALVLILALPAAPLAFAAGVLPDSENAALVRFFNATGGANWRTKTNWPVPPATTTTSNGCDWYGVTCDAASGPAHVVGIGLPGNQLSGSLPDLADFPALQSFNVGFNQLTGHLPSLAGLTNLSVFVASGNLLDGPLPDLNEFTALTLFAVNDNQLSGRLPSLTASTALRNFDVGGNRLTGTLPGLDNLDALQHFVVNRNQLTGPVPNLANLTRLVELSLYDNQLTGPLPTLTGLAALEHLDASHNQLSGMLPDLSGLTSLNDFNVGSNQFSGPLMLPDLPNLFTIDVSHNRLSGNLPSLGNAPKLIYVLLADNRFSGVIPAAPSTLNERASSLCPNALTRNGDAAIDAAWDKAAAAAPWDQDCRLPADESNALVAFYHATGGEDWIDKTKWLDTATSNGCDWFGVSCDVIDGTVRVTGLGLWSNALTGILPPLDGFPALQDFNVADNALTGPIPSLAGHEKLASFEVSSNRLGGPIPPLLDLPALRYFSVVGNQLSGSVPALATLAALEYFDASFNELTGPVPPLAGLSKLRRFGASSNHLGGPLPPLPPNLTELLVGRNELSGSLDLSAAPGLQVVDVFSNRFDGSMPSVANLSALLRIYLGGNDFSGPVPDPPTDSHLESAQSSLCPNRLSLSPTSATNTAWDRASQSAPWNRFCNQAMTMTGPTTAARGTTATYHVAVHALTGSDVPAGVDVTLTSSVEQCAANPSPGQAPVCAFVTDPTAAVCPLSATGDADCTLQFILEGEHHLVAYYGGDGTHFTGQYALLDVTVGTPVDGICGSDDGKTLPAPPVNLCSIGTPSVVQGSGPWTWTCQGSQGGATASCSAQKTPAGRTPTLTALDLAPNPASVGQSVTATVSVNESAPAARSAAALAAAAGGIVTVSGGGKSCSASLANGSASCSLSFDAPGTYAVSASYAGDATHAPSSDTRMLVVNAAGNGGGAPATAPALDRWALILLLLSLGGVAAYRRSPRR